MAEYMAQGREDAPVSGKSFTTFTNWIGAVLSLALVIGVAVWGYKLLMRDVNGIPVVRAVEGPMRLQPETHGGSTADHQGLAVNQIAATGTAAPPPDRLVLAPRPVALAEEDVTTADLMATAQILPMPRPVEPASTMDDGAVSASNPDADISLRLASAGMISLDEVGRTSDLQIEPAVMTRAEPDTMSAMVDQILAQVLEAEATPAVMTVPAVEGGVGQSLRPQARPASLVRESQTASLGPVAIQANSAPVQDVDAASIPVGTRLVQLGAFDSPEVAKREWDRLAARFGDYLQGKSRVIQLAESGGRNFYRLRAMGFADINDSRRFCSALLAERAECIPVSAK